MEEREKIENSEKLESLNYKKHPFYIFGLGLVAGVVGTFAVMAFVIGTFYTSNNTLTKEYVPIAQMGIQYLKMVDVLRLYMDRKDVKSDYLPKDTVRVNYIPNELVRDSFVSKEFVKKFYVRKDNVFEYASVNGDFPGLDISESIINIPQIDQCANWSDYHYFNNIHRTIPYPVFNGRAYLYSFGWPNLQKVELYLIKSIDRPEGTWTDMLSDNVIHRFRVNGIVDREGSIFDSFRFDGCEFIGYALGLPSEDNDAQSFQFKIRSQEYHRGIR